MERRLAAILAADVVGYTRLMGKDEAGTLRRLTELRRQSLEPLIGDGLLVEFASVVDALTCALAWQCGVSERETAADEDDRLRFRIGNKMPCVRSGYSSERIQVRLNSALGDLAVDLETSKLAPIESVIQRRLCLLRGEAVVLRIHSESFWSRHRAAQRIIAVAQTSILRTTEAQS